ncbi:expressed unknown protein [Seminavis robusta]|uniref:Uncharacterized protein n=1 Tax=Seminavis robusta TaxID=568900 RepID=A0A9N8F0W1_9STRA|nr:expressed unknown protein [Seminavis robusta]|eukprot:Sro2476_g328780.1 n/a (155) ;mRNA; r:8540-9004
MTSQVATRRQTVPIKQEKRRKPRRQSGHAVAFENKETVVQRSRLERTDSDKVIRRNSMERKMSVRNSMKLPQDFLKGLTGLDDSLNRMSMSGSCRGLNDSKGEVTSENANTHGPSFSKKQLEEMSKQALQFSDSDTEDEVELDLEDAIVLEEKA